VSLSGIIFATGVAAKGTLGKLEIAKLETALFILGLIVFAGTEGVILMGVIVDLNSSFAVKFTSLVSFTALNSLFATVGVVSLSGVIFATGVAIKGTLESGVFIDLKSALGKFTLGAITFEGTQGAILRGAIFGIGVIEALKRGTFTSGLLSGLPIDLVIDLSDFLRPDMPKFLFSAQAGKENKNIPTHSKIIIFP
jgi:hypothetical protein